MLNVHGLLLESLELIERIHTASHETMPLPHPPATIRAV